MHDAWFPLTLDHKYCRHSGELITCLYINGSVCSLYTWQRQKSSTISSIVCIASLRSSKNTWPAVLFHRHYAQPWIFIAATILPLIYHTCITVSDILIVTNRSERWWKVRQVASVHRHWVWSLEISVPFFLLLSLAESHLCSGLLILTVGFFSF